MSRELPLGSRRGFLHRSASVRITVPVRVNRQMSMGAGGHAEWKLGKVRGAGLRQPRTSETFWLDHEAGRNMEVVTRTDFFKGRNAEQRPPLRKMF